MKQFSFDPLIYKYCEILKRWLPRYRLNKVTPLPSIFLYKQIVAHNCCSLNSPLFDSYASRLIMLDFIYPKLSDSNDKVNIRELVISYIEEGLDNLYDEDENHENYYIAKYKSMYHDYVVIQEWIQLARIKLEDMKECSDSDFARLITSQSAQMYDNSFYVELVYAIDSCLFQTSYYYEILQVMFLNHFTFEARILGVNSIIHELPKANQYKKEIAPYLKDLHYMLILSYYVNDKFHFSIRLLDYVKDFGIYVVFTVNENHKIIKEVSNATLDVLNILTKENITTSLIKNDVKPLLKETLNYLHDNKGFSSVQMKNNFLSASVKTPLPLKDISDVYKDIYPKSKLHIVENSHVYSRILGEIPIAHNFTERFKEYFEGNTLTGDSLITHRKGQTNPDLIQRLKQLGNDIKSIESDIKAGNNMTRHPLKATIGQIAYLENEQIRLPNDPIDLNKFSESRLKEFRIFNSTLMDKNFILPNDRNEYFHYSNEVEMISKKVNLTIIEKHIEIERILIKIQSIPSMPKRPSYINIIQLGPSRILSSNEKDFLEGIIPFINKDIFKNQTHYNNFIRRALKVYNETIDKQAIAKIKELKGTSWELTFQDRIEIDVFA